MSESKSRVWRARDGGKPSNKGGFGFGLGKSNSRFNNGSKTKFAARSSHVKDREDVETMRVKDKLATKLAM